MKSGNRTLAYFRVELITQSEQLTYQAYVTAFLDDSLFEGIFILEHFLPLKRTLPSVYERIQSVRYEKGKLNLTLTPFSEVLLTGLWDLKDMRDSRQNHSKNKLIGENAVT